MADALVIMLNSYGYQPVYLPRTGLVPPELYNFAKKKLVRRGELARFFQKPVVFTPTRGKLADLQGKLASNKNYGAAVDFLQNALRILGIGAVPKVDLSFTGSKEFTFTFSDVTFQAVDPAILDGILQDLSIPLAIPDSYVEFGDLHIAYEYAYAKSLTMSRSDGKSFDTNLRGDVGAYLNLGAKGSVELTGNSTVSFSSGSEEVAAFAYKAGQLLKEEERWTFQPEIVKRAKGIEKREVYIPSRNRVPVVEEG